MSYLPFQGISYIPSMIFTNGFSHSDVMICSFSQQLIWVIILMIPIGAFMDTWRKNS